jgi:hypothetical protein
MRQSTARFTITQFRRARSDAPFCIETMNLAGRTAARPADPQVSPTDGEFQPALAKGSPANYVHALLWKKSSLSERAAQG